MVTAVSNQILNIEVQEEGIMSGLVNHVPELISRLGWDNREFVARCMLAGIGWDTAHRLIRGETNFGTKTLAIVADVLKVPSIGNIIDIDPGEKSQ